MEAVVVEYSERERERERERAEERGKKTTNTTLADISAGMVRGAGN